MFRHGRRHISLNISGPFEPCARRYGSNPLELPIEVFAKRSPNPKADELCFYSSDWVDLKLPARHRFPIDKYQRVRELLEMEGLPVREGPLATFDEACLAHDAEYVKQIFTGMATDEMRRRVGFKEAPMKAYVLRTLASLGATLAAVRHTLSSGIWSGAVSGGTHHAFANAGEGFCVFNDIAVAARLAQQEFGISSVLVIDLDVHQGNGTAKIFAGDPTVFTVSLHQQKGYPFSTRYPSDVEINLLDGCKDEDYLLQLQAAVEGIIQRQRPEVMIFQAGVDCLAGDRFGRLALTHKGLQERNRFVYTLAAMNQIPLIVTMGGGYHKDILQTIDASADVYRQAAQTWQKESEKKIAGSSSVYCIIQLDNEFIFNVQF